MVEMVHNGSFASWYNQEHIILLIFFIHYYSNRKPKTYFSWTYETCILTGHLLPKSIHYIIFERWIEILIWTSENISGRSITNIFVNHEMITHDARTHEKKKGLWLNRKWTSLPLHYHRSNWKLFSILPRCVLSNVKFIGLGFA